MSGAEKWLKIEEIEEICDMKVWSIEYYGSNVNTLDKIHL